MVFNYIIKSYKGIRISDTGDIFNDVKKDVVTSPIDALKVYKEHKRLGLDPEILKRVDRNWIEIKEKDLEQDKAKMKAVKVKGLKKAFQIVTVGLWRRWQMKRGTYKKCTRKRNKLIKQLKELCRVDYKIDNKTLILKLDISKTEFYRNFKSIADECRKLNRSESLFG